jgi:hypothetical protein
MNGSARTIHVTIVECVLTLLLMHAPSRHQSKPLLTAHQ